jgi:hypothetical protein
MLFEVLALAIDSERRAQERYLCAALLADCGERLVETFTRLASDSASREAELRLRLAELSLARTTVDSQPP